MASGLAIVGGFAALLIIGIIVVYGVMIYNGLVRLRRNIDKAWGNIDVLLKQRQDELTKLIDTTKQYMDYEKDVLQQITEARSKAQKASSPKEKGKAEAQMQGALGNFFAVAEDYPELKSNENFQQLQSRISEIEEQIADRREFYNDSVNTYNIRINQIPYNIFASLMGYEDKELFEVPEEEKQDVDISEAFSQS